MELESELAAFRRRGLGVAAISYDSVEILAAFAARKTITFPLLSDPDSSIIRRFGIENVTDYPEGDRARGVPYPGTFVTDTNGVVRSKSFEKTYVERRTAASLLALDGKTPAQGTEAQTSTFTLRTSMTNGAAAPGQRLTLVLDFEMKRGMHAYAPGVSGYRPLGLKLDAHPLMTAHDPVFPPSKPFVFVPLEEPVPVFEGRFRVRQDVTLAGGRDLGKTLEAPDPKIEITGTLEYQVCSEDRCYPPGSLPLKWTIKLIPLDRERVPEGLQRKTSAGGGKVSP